MVNEIFLQMALVYKLLCSPNSANESVVYPDNTGCRLTCASDNRHWPHGKLTISIHSQNVWINAEIYRVFSSTWLFFATDICLPMVNFLTYDKFLQVTLFCKWQFVQIVIFCKWQMSTTFYCPFCPLFLIGHTSQGGLQCIFQGMQIVSSTLSFTSKWLQRN